MNPAASETRAARRSESRPRADAPLPDMHVTLRRDIAAPFAVLRASIEALSVDLDREDPRGTILDGAIEEIVRLGRNVQALVDYALPSRLHALTCSLEELVRTAYLQLAPQPAASTHVAIETGEARACVDGALFTRCLTYLMSAYVGVGDQALLHASADARVLTISLLVESHGSGHSQGSATARLGRPQDDRLAMLLAEREIDRMGGSLETSRLSSNSMRLVLCLPRETEGGR